MEKQPEIIQRKTYTIQQVIDYTECSLCYYLKYIKKAQPAPGFLADNQNIAYQEAVLETIRFYYLEHQNGKPPALKTLYDKYYRLWLNKTGKEESASILTRKAEDSTKHAREKRSKYINMGYETLRKFYGQNAKTKQAVLAVHHPYEIKLEEMSITGNFDLIREVMNPKTKRREIELVSFQLSQRKPDERTVLHDLNLTAMSYGFKETFDVLPDRFSLYYINRNETVSVFRETNEYKRMFAVLDGFRQSVDTIVPYPRPGAHRLPSPYKDICDNYQY